MKQVVSIMLILFCMGWATNSFAQQQQEELTVGNKAFLIISSASMPSTTTFSVASGQIDKRTEELKEEIKRLETLTFLRRYIDNNEREVQLAITIGGGEALKDLVAIIDRRKILTPEFAKKIRKNRLSFMRIITQSKSLDRAESMYSLLLELRSKTKHLTAKKGGQQ